ncbi:hypothetical protein D3C72_1527480 [compost metagenome]
MGLLHLHCAFFAHVDHFLVVVLLNLFSFIIVALIETGALFSGLCHHVLLFVTNMIYGSFVSRLHVGLFFRVIVLKVSNIAFIFFNDLFLLLIVFSLKIVQFGLLGFSCRIIDR